MFPAIRHQSLLAKAAPWALMLALVLILSSCAFAGVIGLSGSTLMVAMTLFLAACGGGGGGGGGGGSQSTSSSVFNLSSLDGSNGFTILGENNSDYAGRTVSAAGDLNGDGYPDLIVATPSASSGGSRRGAVYVVFGQSSGFAWSSTFALSTLDGSNGFKILGTTDFAYLGYSVAAVGDINGDGYPDLIIGESGPGNSSSHPGTVYVVFGQSGGFNGSSTFDLTTLDGSNGFKIVGIANDSAGKSVSTAGDFNSDEHPDLLIGASKAAAGGTARGAAYVVFGQSSGFAWPSTVFLSDLNGTNGFALLGVNDQDATGAAVSAAGDINGDGYPDLIIGAYNAAEGGTNRGAAYVVFGQSSGFAWSSTFALGTLNGSNGFIVPGANDHDHLGRAVSAAGDINGDGYPDLVIGATGAAAGGTNRGAVVVVFGQSSGFTWCATMALSTFSGSTGFQFQGVTDGETIGRSLSAVGDINGDGYADLLIGVYKASAGGITPGAGYAAFGQSGGFAWSSTVALSTFNGGTGYELEGTSDGDLAGFSVSAAGDFNGDGHPDLLIGAPDAAGGGSHRGAAYVVFGK